MPEGQGVKGWGRNREAGNFVEESSTSENDGADTSNMAGTGGGETINTGGR